MRSDTGTSILLMHDDIVKEYYDQVSGAYLDTFQKGFVYPCQSSLPDLGIVVSETYTATIPGTLMTFNTVDEDKKSESVSFLFPLSLHSTLFHSNQFLKCLFIFVCE